MLSLFVFLSKWVGWDSYTFVLNLCGVLMRWYGHLTLRIKPGFVQLWGSVFRKLVCFFFNSVWTRSVFVLNKDFATHKLERESASFKSWFIYFSSGSACLSPLVIVLEVFWRALSRVFAIISLNVHSTLRCVTAVTVRMIGPLHLMGFKNDAYFKTSLWCHGDGHRYI